MDAPLDILELKAHEGKRVELRFRDGHVARVHLISVDPGSPEVELIYDVIEIIEWGPVDPMAVDKNAAAAASFAELESWKLLE